MSRADLRVSDTRPASGGRLSVSRRRVRLRGLPTRVSLGVRDLAVSMASVLASLLMAKVKPAAVLERGGHHTPGGASLGHGFS